MKEKNYLVTGSGENCADIRYLSNLSTPDDFLFVEIGHRSGRPGRKMVIVSALEFDRARASVPAGVEVVDSAEFGSGTLAEQIANLAEKYGISEFNVPGYFPLIFAEKLRAKDIRIIPVAGDFISARQVKSAKEIALITRALRAAESGMRRAWEIIASTRINDDGKLYLPSGEVLSSEYLRREIDLQLLREGCLGVGTIAASGRQAVQPHHYGTGEIYTGTPIVLDIFPRDQESGYWGDLTRTVVRGKAPELIKNVYECVKEARDLAKKSLAVGAIPSEIHLNTEKFFAQRHFFTGSDDTGNFGFFHSLGHGVGLDIHEAPRVGPRNKMPLQAGEVVTVEPGLYYPEWGGLRLEDMGVVRPDHFENLTQIEDILEL